VRRGRWGGDPGTLGLARPWLLVAFGCLIGQGGWILGAGAATAVRWTLGFAGALLAAVGAWAVLSYPVVPRALGWLAALVGAGLAATPWALGFASAHPADRDLVAALGVLVLADALSLAVWPPRGAGSQAGR